MSELAHEATVVDKGVAAPELSNLAARQTENAAAIVDRIFSAARPGLVFGEPITSGSYTVITASEVTSGGGFGSGTGFGRSEPRREAGTPETQAAPSNLPSIGGGGGMGGGGGAVGRPVAVISIGPDGVSVRPIYDVTKVALAGLAAAGTVLAIVMRSRRFGR